MMGKLFCTVLPDMNRFAADIFQQLNRRVRISLMTYVRGVRIWSSAIRSSTKVTGLIAISRSAIEKARQQRHMAENDFQNWNRIRNGVETIPSTLRNQYHVDDMPVRGRIPCKFFFGAKISAINFKKLLRQRRGLYCRPHNPLLA